MGKMPRELGLEGYEGKEEKQMLGEVREHGEVTVVPWGWLMGCFEVRGRPNHVREPAH